MPSVLIVNPRASGVSDAIVDRVREELPGDTEVVRTEGPGDGDRDRTRARARARRDLRPVGGRHLQRGPERRGGDDAARLPAGRRNERPAAGARVGARPGRCRAPCRSRHDAENRSGSRERAALRVQRGHRSRRGARPTDRRPRPRHGRPPSRRPRLRPRGGRPSHGAPRTLPRSARGGRRRPRGFRVRRELRSVHVRGTDGPARRLRPAPCSTSVSTLSARALSARDRCRASPSLFPRRAARPGHGRCCTTLKGSSSGATCRFHCRSTARTSATSSRPCSKPSATAVTALVPGPRSV